VAVDDKLPLSWMINILPHGHGWMIFLDEKDELL
jgi:hypothetical protein